VDYDGGRWVIACSGSVGYAVVMSINNGDISDVPGSGVTSYELWQVATDFVSADLMIWKLYRNFAPGMVEAFLDANPQLSHVHRSTPFIPPGTYVRIPINPSLKAGKPKTSPTVSLWTDKAQYSL
jgi:phage tail protein X